MYLKKWLLFLCLLNLFCACQAPSSVNDHSPSQVIDTLFDYKPLYKENIVDGKTIIDTTYQAIKKERRIFRKGRTYTYKATYLSPNKDTLSIEKVEMISTGKRIKIDWMETQPKHQIQDQIFYHFYWTQEDSAKFVNNPTINSQYPYANLWQKNIEQGIIENEEQVWIHPPRFNQYRFTQVCPYPEVQRPLYVDKEWFGGLQMYDGQGDWDYAQIKQRYKVIRHETLKLPFTKPSQCWLIQSESKFHLGHCFLDYYFHQEYGFVKMTYKNYINEILILELIDVTDQK